MTYFRDDKPWYHTLGVFDLETTGVDVATSRIVSANVSVLGQDGEPVERTDWLANPGIDIPVQASQVHGITTERAKRDGRAAPEVIAEIIDALRRLLAGGTPVVVYNAPYDFSLLRHEALRYGIEPLIAPSPIIDPLVIDKEIDRYRRGKRTLEAASAVYGVELLDAHDAGADAIAAGRIAQAMGTQNRELMAMTAQELHARQVDWSAAQSASFAEYMRRTRDPNFVDAAGWPLR